VHAFCTGGACVSLPDGQLGYAAGHVVCWFWQTRGVTPTSHVEPARRQSEHEAPFDPHAVSMKPASHVPCASQQPTQLDGPQGGGGARQTPPLHTSPIALQLVHAWPPRPHAPSPVPVTHAPVVGSQHPLQLVGPHAGAPHAPFVHCSAALVQFTHVDPFTPHAVSCVPMAHTPFTQHPGHVAGPHVASQKPFTHVDEGPHGWHCAPPVPHAPTCVPATHVLPWQQPAQFVASHVAATTHAPPVHWVPVPHCAHATPFAPQSKSSVPGKHAFPTQHPAQLVTSHVPVVSHTLPTHDALEPQGMHVWPPNPQAPSLDPARHVLPRQHPAQFDGLHVTAVTHLPPRHSWFGPHTWQTEPARPHALGVSPEEQRPFESQHPLQVPLPQANVAQIPPPPAAGVHCSFVAPHGAHAAPPKPHAFGSVPTRHELPWQHPLQFDASHVVFVQTPPLDGCAAQVKPSAAQSWHAWPNSPHALSFVPTRHVSAEQQPSQFDGLHVLPTQTWAVASHVSPKLAQFWQRTPPFPHAVEAVPGTQTPFAQQPLHVDGSQPVGPDRHVRVFGSQAPSAEQSAQAFPPIPQALTAEPGTHSSPAQHPWVQVAGEQACPPSGDGSPESASSPEPASALGPSNASSIPDRPHPARANVAKKRERHAIHRARSIETLRCAKGASRPHAACPAP
jgi:hypothetical protein